jgi:hypothetical protein
MWVVRGKGANYASPTFFVQLSKKLKKRMSFNYQMRETA